MTLFANFKRLTGELPQIAQQAGYTIPQIYGAFCRCYLRRHVSLTEFRVLQLYKYSNAELSRFLLWCQLPKIQKKLNRGVTPEELSALHNKNSFNALFHEYVHRDWLYCPDSTTEDILTFLRRNETFLIKPVDTCMGDGIQLLLSREVNEDDFLSQYRREKVVLEAYITQHPAMAALNPTSVNTVRITTARRNGRVHIVGACLRCGGAGSYLDNFHSGGMAYPLDIETGIVSGPGNVLNTEKPSCYSPATGRIVTGFQIPHWDQLIRSVTEAANRPPHLGYLAWDVAVTPEGVEFVEVNVNNPDSNVIQLNDNPAYGRLKNFMTDAG